LLQENLERLYKEYAGCQALIELLEQAKEEITEEYLKTTEDSLHSTAFDPSIQGLAETVKSQQEEEVNKEDQEQLDYAEDYAQEIIDSANQQIDQNTEKTTDEVKDGGLEVREEIKNAESQLAQPMSSIENSINEINDVLKSNKQ
jgi:glutamyl-tRNA reductase